MNEPDRLSTARMSGRIRHLAYTLNLRRELDALRSENAELRRMIESIEEWADVQRNSDGGPR